MVLSWLSSSFSQVSKVALHDYQDMCLLQKANEKPLDAAIGNTPHLLNPMPRII